MAPIIARIPPEPENRVIPALKAHGHVVGYPGDGIKDAPSRHTADVGIVAIATLLPCTPLGAGRSGRWLLNRTVQARYTGRIRS